MKLIDRLHVIADIHFEHSGVYEQAPVSCRCGWEGVVAGWQDHRRAVGARSTDISHTIGNRVWRAI